jgi:SAM-dependent methyltransferase
MSSQAEAAVFYDAHVARRLESFVEGNARVERAWRTVVDWAPPSPRRVLEVGCGIGDVSWRMARLWPGAHVTGLDLSRKSVEMARRLFALPNLTFLEGTLLTAALIGDFDLILLMDVYEHIARDERAGVHTALGALASERARLILSFPTPRHQRWLRAEHPDELQPVDEDIYPETAAALAEAVGASLALYREVDVWHEADYAHAVLVRRSGYAAVAEWKDPTPGVRESLRLLLRRRSARSRDLDRSGRLDLVRERLGPGYYR